MNGKNIELDVLVQPAFLIGLAVLLFNDFYLKSHYPCWVTGKLSDFSGLYIFTQFVAALARINIRSSAIASAFLFVFWKSSVATPFIEFVNQYSATPIYRTVDYTDLIALGILPLAVRLYSIRVVMRWCFLKYPIALLSLFAIMGTSTIPPSYNLRFDLRPSPNSNVNSSDNIYENIEQYLTGQGMQCRLCEKESSYRDYIDADAKISASFNYDAQSKTLFVLLHTYSPDKSKVRIDELHAGIMHQLHPQFENVTVVRSQYSTQSNYFQKPTQIVTMEFPNVGLPLTCSGNGINNPEVSKAIKIIDKSSNLVDAINLRQNYCFAIGADRCGGDHECRHVAFGPVTGPQLGDRGIHLDTRMYVGWGGTTLRTKLSGDNAESDEAVGFIRNLEKQLRGALRDDIKIVVEKPDAESASPADRSRTLN